MPQQLQVSAYVPQAAVGSQGQAQPQGDHAVPIIVPFGRSAKWHGEQGVTQTLAPPWASQQQFLVPSYGYLRAIYLTIAATGGNLTAATAHADAPFNVLNNLLVADVNGTPLWNLDGYASYIARLYGGYRAFGGVPLPTVNPSGASALLDASAAGYSPVSASNGQFKYIFEVFHEFARDGLGALANMDASAAYKVTLTYNSSAASATGVYTAETGTTAPTLNTTLEGLMRSRPAGSDAQGRTQEVQPPSPGTVQYWSSQTFQVSSGSNTLILSRVGNIIRNHILIFRDAGGSRANADSTGVTPTTLELDWDAGQRFILNTATLRQIAAELNNFDNPAGVVPLQYTDDPNGIAIGEYGDGWIPTVGSTKLQFRFTSAAAGTLQVLTNDIVPGASDIYNLGQLSGR